MLETLANLPWWMHGAGILILLLASLILYLEFSTQPVLDESAYEDSAINRHVTAPAIPSHLVQHLQDLVEEYKQVRDSYEETIPVDNEGRILSCDDFEELCRYDALINNAELALLRLKNPHVSRSAPA